ncbi:hypothetical protein CK203_039041 [Vitis vinifera]|uniref:Uncharacterized protein n=1 Tax=Vitis vinifera TaxID=29760 RepID=A0A438HLS0_VITVI|nr:hypothetical protein CK203_039041 [Vitis vinifera]
MGKMSCFFNFKPESCRDQMREEPVELSGSFLAYSALALLIFTIFYNVLFLTVIQPSIDVQ